MKAINVRTIAAAAVTASILAFAGACSTTPAAPGSTNTASGTTQTGAGFGGMDVDKDAPVVLTTFTVLADIAQNVAGNHLRVESLTKPGTEIHGYEPTPGDLKRAVHADLVLNNGLGLEVWFEKFMTDVKAPRVTVSEGIDTMDITADAYAGKPNPHAWMSPLNVHTYVDNMVKAFTELTPQHAASFETNAAAYKQELQTLHNELVEGTKELPEQQRALVTCEGAFSYLARDSQLQEFYIWPVNAENQATPQQIASAVNFVKDNSVPAVFCESTVASDPMERVAEASGAEFAGVLYVDSLSLSDGPVPTYMDLIKHDVEVIVGGLNGEAASLGDKK